MLGLEMRKAHLYQANSSSHKDLQWIQSMTIFGGCPLMTPVKGWVLTGGEKDFFKWLIIDETGQALTILLLYY